jgi:hypothetical protein
MARRVSSSRLYKATLDEYVRHAEFLRDQDRRMVAQARDAVESSDAPVLPYKVVPRAPEWVYRRLAGLPATTPEATVTDEDLDIERRIEHFPEQSLDGFDELVGGAW